MQITEMTALELGETIKRREVSAPEAVRAYLDRIRRMEPSLHSFVTVDEEGAAAQAEAVQKKLDAGVLTGPLAGVPFAVKDNLCTKGLRTTCASRMLEQFTPPYEAEAVCRLRAAGGVVLGKTNMDEFAMGSTTETSAFGVTRNPWDLTRAPGGSSGGSCAAVAAGEAPFALGTDTGGSIRQPAAFCGAAGLKPTYGTVSRYGLIAYASSFDQIGPVAGTIADCAAVLEQLAATDPKDSTSVRHPDGRFTAALTGEAKGLKVGILADYLTKELQEEVHAAVVQAAKLLECGGAVVESVSLGGMEYAVPAYYVIASAEASSNLARFDGVKYGYRTEAYDSLRELYEKSRSEGFGEEAKRRILLGTFVLSAGYYDAYYRKALRARALIRESFEQAFERYDVLMTPVARTTAPVLGESLKDPVRMCGEDLCTVAVNLAGLPAASVPVSFDQKGLPVGVQLIAGRFQERQIIRAASVLEAQREHPEAFRRKRREESRSGEEV